MSSTPGATWLMTNAYQHIVERAAKVNIWNKRLGKYQQRQGNSNFSVKNIWICMHDCIHTKPCTPTLVEFKVTVTNATFNITRSLTRNVTVILYMWLTKALKRICGIMLSCVSSTLHNERFNFSWKSKGSRIHWDPPSNTEHSLKPGNREQVIEMWSQKWGWVSDSRDPSFELGRTNRKRERLGVLT